MPEMDPLKGSIIQQRTDDIVKGIQELGKGTK